MNQILITEKLYVTPELKRKKKIYRFNFIASIVIIIVLCLFYAHAEYAKIREESVSEELLSNLIEESENTTEEERQIAEQDEDVWKIMIASSKNQTQEASNEQQTNNNGSTTNTSNKTTNKNTSSKTAQKRTKTITVNNKRYLSLGRIKISKIGVDCAILDETDDENELVANLKVSPCKFYGVDPNEIGNCCIAGHNYRNKRFFSKVPKLVVGDKIQIIDVSGKSITYSVYDKYTVYPEEVDCLKETVTGKRIVTLITCTDDGEQRVIVHAKEI